MASTSALKVLAYVVNIICALLGLVLISFGIYVLASYDVNEMGSIYSYAYMVVGGAALVILLWGYLSAWRENVCCTVTFITLLYLVILAQVGIIYLMITHADTASSNLANSLDDTWDKELDSPGAMTLYENWFGCCGRGSAQDYIVNERLPPASCFVNQEINNPESLIHKGCRVEFENYWLNLITIFNIIAWVLVAAELLLSIFSCCLCNSIRNDHRRSYY